MSAKRLSPKERMQQEREQRAKEKAEREERERAGREAAGASAADALATETPAPHRERARMIPTEGVTDITRSVRDVDRILSQRKLDPAQIRVRPDVYNRDTSTFQGKEWDDFVESIRRTGGNEDPIDVRVVDGEEGQYELVAGERRWRACREADLKVLANIRKLRDESADTLFSIENIKRRGKSYFERGMTFQDLLDSGRYSNQEELARGVHERESTVSEALALVNSLSAEQWNQVDRPSSITQAQGRVLAEASKLGLSEKLSSGGGPLLLRTSSITTKALLDFAKGVIKAASAGPGRPESEGARFVRYKGRHDAVVIPVTLSAEAKKRILDLVQTEIRSAAR